MKRNIIKFLGLVVGVPFIMSSCVVWSRHYTTGNPVGNKEGYVKQKLISIKDDMGIAAAAKKGGISKIATVDIKYYMSGRISVKVTGE